jgi:NAD-dependent deacetylase
MRKAGLKFLSSADKNLITQNIDGLDGKAGNKHYIAIHGRLDQMTLFHHQGDAVDIIDTAWEQVDESRLAESLLELFRIESRPVINESFKPYVLLFDEYYTELYRTSEAQQRMLDASRIVFMGTSFSVNITQMALDIAMSRGTVVEIVDPEPVRINYSNVCYHVMTASEYVRKRESGELD